MMKMIEGAVLVVAELADMNWQTNWKTTSAWYRAIEVVSAKQTSQTDVLQCIDPRILLLALLLINKLMF